MYWSVEKSKSILTTLIILFICGAFKPNSLLAAFDIVAVDARPVGMGSAFVGLVDDSRSIFWNPAGFASQTGLNAGSSYFRPFGMEELDFTTIHVSAGTRWGSLGFGYLGHGDDLYSETSYSLGYGRQIFDRLKFGCTFRFMQLSIADPYGDENAFGPG